MWPIMYAFPLTGQSKVVKRDFRHKREARRIYKRKLVAAKFAVLF